MSLKVTFFTLFVFTSILVNAQSCCSGGIPLSNNIGLAILEKGTTQIGIHYDYNNLNTLNIRNEKLDDNSRLRITHSVLLNLSYSLSNRFSVEGLFTWVNQRRKITQFGNENLDQTSGVGDAILLARYNFPNVIGEHSAISIGFGTKMPLGSSTNKNMEGITLNPDLQPGSNTWDLIYWSSFSKSFDFRPSLIISSRLIYRSTGKNNSYIGGGSYEFGDELQAFISFSDQFLIFKTISTPSLSIKYRTVAQDKTSGFELENTGGNWVSIVPNFAIQISPTLVFSTKVELPIYSHVDGTQLTPTYRITSGVLFAIAPKKKALIFNERL